MRVLVACEFSGIVRDAFLRAGHEAWSCDLEETESDSPNHIVGDVRQWIYQDWDLMIAHPPCTYLANSGVRWLHSRPDRWKLMREGATFFRHLLDYTDIPRVAVENPIIHRYAREIIGKHDQLIQPWQFGHGETKATCLWLRNLPHLQATNIVSEREPRVHRLGPGPNRQKDRSRFFAGIAAAMADQWGSLPLLVD